MSAEPLLTVRGLTIAFGERAAVEDVDLDLEPGEVLGVVGASGSGKSTLALALLGLIDPPGRRVAGEVRFEGRALAWAPATGPRRDGRFEHGDSGHDASEGVRGSRIAMVFQEPLTALNPVLTVGAQVAEGLRLHAGLDRAAAWRRAVEALAEAGLPEPERVARRYPHQLSGGMRQRALIAMAVAPRPRVLVADEPTTALDATLRAELLALFVRLAREHGMALVLVSHDLAAVARIAGRVLVLDAGRVVERGPVAELFARPAHAATRALVSAAGELPGSAATEPDGSRPPELRRPLELLRPPAPSAPPGRAPLLELDGLEVVHRRRRTWLGRERDVVAVRGVSLRVERGEVVALVGESGAGKSSLARCVAGLVEPRAGAVRLRLDSGSSEEDGVVCSLWGLSPKARRVAARRVGIVFQDPVASLNPRHRVLRIVGEAPRAQGLWRPEAVRRSVEGWLTRVGLEPADADRFPHEFSGGQRQRIAIARALATEPEVLVLDEATSSLDAAVRADVLELIGSLARELSLAVLAVSHDLELVRAIADRVAVMYAGRLVEQGTARELFEQPAHPYTRLLLAAASLTPESTMEADASDSGPSRSALASRVPPSTGCAFAPRCSLAESRCREQDPPERVSGTHRARCHLVVEDEG